MRSARLAAAAIAAVVLWMDKDLAHRHAVAIDGSLFQKYPGFKDAMRSCLMELLGDRAARIAFMPVQDGSGIGAAIIAAVAASARAPSDCPAIQ
jgi:hexokinase